MLTRKGRFSFLIPMDYGDKIKPYPIPKNKYKELLAGVHSTLQREFGGYSSYHNQKNPIQGSWIAPNGTIVQDRHTLYMVLTEEVNRARRFFRYYKGEIQKKFKQQLVAIVEETIDII